MSRPVALAVNPASGRGRGASAGAAARAVLAAAGVDVVELTGRDGADLAGQARAAVADGIAALVVVGGDGTTHLGVNAVAGTGTALGIVAAGTGNDVARGAGLPIGDWAGAAQVVLRGLAGAVRAVDAVRVTRPGPSPEGQPSAPIWFAAVLAAGFDAAINARANRMTWPAGRRRYDLALLAELPGYRQRSYRLTLDDRVVERDAMIVAVANTPTYGGGMRICPDALIDDGLLDVLVAGPIGRLELLTIFPRVFSGTHVAHRRVEVFRSRRVEVAADAVVGYADGERLAALPLICEAVPGALLLLADPAGR